MITKLIFGEEKAKKLQTSNILVVGAGGIGCEVVKNLAKGGYKNFTVIDLDTIELSNLNR